MIRAKRSEPNEGIQVVMKSFYAVLAALCVSICMAGCGSSEPATEPTQPRTPERAQEVPAVPSDALLERRTPAALVQDELGELPDVLAAVGDIEVTYSDYLIDVAAVVRNAAARVKLAGQSGVQMPAPDLFTAKGLTRIFQNLLNKKVILVLAEREGIVVDEGLIDARIQAMKEKLPSGTTFEDFLTSMKMQEVKLRNEFRQGIIQERYRELLGRDCTVSDEELAAEYETLKSEGRVSGPEEVDFWQILATVRLGSDDEVWKTTKSKILWAQQRILAGEDFGDVARDMSDDPSAAENGGFFEGAKRTRMTPDLANALFTIPIGELSDPVRGTFGWQIIKVKARRAEGVRSLEAIRPQLRARLLARCKKERVSEAVAKARVEIGVTVLAEALSP